MALISSYVPDVATLADLEETPHAEVFADSPRAVRLTLSADESIPPHRHPDEAVLLHVLSGELELRLDGDSNKLSEGDLIRFDGEHEIEPVAITDTVALVVFTPA